MLTATLGAESIERFTEGQAFSPSYDFAPSPHPPPPPVSKLDRRHIGPPEEGEKREELKKGGGGGVELQYTTTRKPGPP